MLVYRIEGKHNPDIGPWNGDEQGELLDVLAAISDAPSTNPAGLADIVARAMDEPMPSEMPGPNQDGIVDSRKEFFTQKYHSGFKSVDQYHQWFRKAPIRRALYMEGKMVFVSYEVPDDKVRQGGHQVAFRMRDAKNRYVLPKRVAIDD